ncbi:hypothetical protein [Woodsholea maritima]|uniref:hypothetical protein n=1 Tax=Woodsholea maritima TaxID=240237 RepID=UPI000370004C|nr:hypothetical protein [Woodsholea maritima]
MNQDHMTSNTNDSHDTLHGEKLDFVKLSPEELAARNKRNIMIALSLVGFMGLIFAVTVIRLASNISAGGAG